MKSIKGLSVICLLVTLTACTWWGKDDEIEDTNSAFKGMTAKQLFTEAETAIQKEQYDSAAKRFEALESMYPFSDYAEKAQMDLIYTYYQNSDYPSSAATAERYIHLYPRSAHVDYAYYMKGLANFQQVRGSFTKIIPMDESWRDSGSQAQAYADLSTFVQRFPNSPYRANALQRLIYLRNTFAQRELNTAVYYYERKRFVAAAERANYLIKNYQQAPSVQMALAVLYKANLALGLNKAAQDALTVYQVNYPNQSIDLIA